jgi:hypothetical protein
MPTPKVISWLGWRIFTVNICPTTSRPSHHHQRIRGRCDTWYQIHIFWVRICCLVVDFVDRSSFLRFEFSGLDCVSAIRRGLSLPQIWSKPTLLFEFSHQEHTPLLRWRCSTHLHITLCRHRAWPEEVELRFFTRATSIDGCPPVAWEAERVRPPSAACAAPPRRHGLRTPTWASWRGDDTSVLPDKIRWRSTFPGFSIHGSGADHAHVDLSFLTVVTAIRAPSTSATQDSPHWRMTQYTV